MSVLSFSKYEGLGNDFVLVEADRDDAISSDLARALCDRRRGVGADGVLLLLSPRREGALARMRVVNADGSTPEMCGNGLRCLALHVAATRGLSTGELVVETDAGPRACNVDVDEGIVTVEMGVVRYTEDTTIDVEGEEWVLSLADAGNPHAVTCKRVDRAVIDAVGPRLATHPVFPNGTNVEFARFGDDSIDLVVWERGVGVTLACGTGACATVAVGIAKGLLRADRPISVRLPGGCLEVRRTGDGRTFMRGPARRVFQGEFSEARTP